MKNQIPPPEPTPREKEILAIMGEGIGSNLVIAARLNRSPDTIKNHKDNLKAKFGLNSCQELLQLAVQMKLERSK